jgi:predicted ATPase/class 3 adenylate cyclase
MPGTSEAHENPQQPVPLPTGTVTFLFTDIEGSTQRWEAHRSHMGRAVARHDELLRNAVASHRGSVFKTVGDAFCVAFARPQDAVTAAIDAQRELMAEDFASVGGIRVRMAIHTGTAEERDGDYFGAPVNRVARLLSIGHGGQVLVSQAAADLLQGVMPEQSSVRDLGQHQLRDLVRPEQVYQLVGPGLEEKFPPLRSLETLPNNLPRQATAFVGREHELSELKTLLEKSQIVTLVGTGGIGKTRTALQVGAELLDSASDGVWFVDLAQVGTEDTIANAIAAVFGLQLQPDGKPLDDICLYLTNKRLMFILDNCEHIVAETARVVTALVKNCPKVVVLATSREVLNVQGEHVYRMPSLSLPPRNITLTAEEALKHEAVVLFVARATALDTRFVLTDDKAPIVADICRRLDGIALAIELAAARVSILNLKQLSQRLDERFRVLTGGDRTALPRQQTMRATIDWSYELLSEVERTVFRRLSVFQGGWSLEAASEVCTDETLDELGILDVLSSLVNKSLVMVDADADTQRYRLLESLRQYGLELLQKQEEVDPIARRHARFCAGYARQIADQWLVLPTLAWLTFVEAELDNIRAALHWSLDSGNDPALGAEIAEHLWAYWIGHNKLEGYRWLKAARTTISPQSNPRLSVAIDLALTRFQVGSSDDEAYEAGIERAVAAARAQGDDGTLARALFYLGEGHTTAGRHERAKVALIEALDAARRAHDHYRETATLQQLAKLYTNTKQFELAREHFTAAMRYYKKRGVDRNLAIMLLDQAALERLTGDVPRAIALTEEALTIAKVIRERDMEALILSANAAYLTMMKRYDEARSPMRSALIVLRDELLDQREVTLQPCIALAVQDNDFDRAARLLGYRKADRRGWIRETQRIPMDIDSVIESMRDRLGEMRLEELMVEGSAWSQEQAFEEAFAACEDPNRT